jgi:type VI secretion system protein ImpA
MSGPLDEQALLDPIAGDNPCGVSLEDSALLLELDALRLFGKDSPPEAAPGDGDGDGKARQPLEWDRIRAMTLEGLARSKDLRLLSYLGTAALRTDGLIAFNQTLTVAAKWLDAYWVPLYPVIDEDALARRSALNCFADLMAVVDRLRRLPLVTSRQHGIFSLRDMDLASGQIAPGANESRPDEAAMNAAFAEIPEGQLTALHESVTAAVDSLKAIDEKMRSEGGPEMAPSFGPLSSQYSKLLRLCREQLGARASAGSVASVSESGAVPAGAPYAGGAIRSRQDAVRALEAIAEYFRATEPSSPIPLVVDRARRLVSKNFLEVLADIAPEALASARSAGGIKDEQQ